MTGWHPGDPAAGRRFVDVGPAALESGAVLDGVRVAYETWGPVDGPTVLVEHALTGDAHVAGPTGPGQPTPGWWDGLVGPGRALDTDHVRVVATNVLGGCQGTSRVDVPITVRDQVAVEALVADALGIDRFAAVLGGSMGGMRALEWALSHPSRVGAALVLAVGARATADQIGTQSLQVRAITSDPLWDKGSYAGDGPVEGLALARGIAHLTYRGETELDLRFAQERQYADGTGPFSVVSYLDHHGRKLVKRFEAWSYVTLTEAMSSHDVGRGRGGVEAALGACTVPLVVGGVDSDRLYPLRLQHELADLAPSADGVHVITSPYGHDAFLLELEQIAPLVERTLKLGA